MYLHPDISLELARARREDEMAEARDRAGLAARRRRRRLADILAPRRRRPAAVPQPSPAIASR